MADKVIPLKTIQGTEIKRVSLHDSVPDIAVSKTLTNQTAPGIKMHYMDNTTALRIDYKGEVIWMPITNIKAMFQK